MGCIMIIIFASPINQNVKIPQLFNQQIINKFAEVSS